MRSRWVRTIVILILAVFSLTACATFGPPGPSTPAYIGQGKSQAQYDADDGRCRKLATARAGDPAQVQQQQAGSAILGTLLGAAAGAAIGGAISGGQGAGIGAAAGGAFGMGTGLGVGTAQAQSDAARIQQRWDGEYYTCMYAAGHQVPGVTAPRAAPSAPQPAYAPPPPPPPAPQPAAVTPPPPPPAPPAASQPPACKLTGKYVKTPSGFVEVCE